MATGHNTVTTDVRAGERTRTFLKAVIEFNNGASKLDCTIKNISATGARIEITAAVSLPNEFTLHIPHRGDSFRARMIWREKNAVGVHFLQAIQKAATPPPDAPRTISDLEAENTRLKARLREMTRRLESLGQDPSDLNSGH